MKIIPYNYTRTINFVKYLEENNFLKVANSNTTELKFPDYCIISARSFINLTSLKKIWIPSTCQKIGGSEFYEAPFFGCNSQCHIFTDIESSEKIPETWSEYWNYYSKTGVLAVDYGSTIKTYEEYFN